MRATIPMAAAVLLAITWAQLGHVAAAWILVPLGGLAASLFAISRHFAERPGDEAFGSLYLGAPAVALIWLRSGETGLGWTLTLMTVAWSADSAAFLIGSALKGPKLWPRFSPNKTWSGFIGGLVAGVVAAELVSLALPGIGGPGPRWAAPVGVVTALATMAGDLWESMLKRRYGVKDAGSLIPGHGGLLDRVDGLMFAALAMAAARLLIGPEHAG
jgi:phosphatidate cytidylyltransferase